MAVASLAGRSCDCSANGETPSARSPARGTRGSMNLASSNLWVTSPNLEAVETAAVTGCDVVFHIAAKAGVWGRYADFFDTNVTGTQNVVAACKKHGVRRLVYTSTPSVVHGGKDIEGANESLPYPKHFESYYSATKAKAEKSVLAANGEELATTALRPHLVFGPGDPHLVPRIIEAAKAGRLKRIGSKPVKVDVSYIDNAAVAHPSDAADRLDIGTAPAGKAYFISNGEPVELWPFIDRVLAGSRCRSGDQTRLGLEGEVRRSRAGMGVPVRPVRRRRTADDAIRRQSAFDFALVRHFRREARSGLRAESERRGRLETPRRPPACRLVRVGGSRNPRTTSAYLNVDKRRGSPKGRTIYNRLSVISYDCLLILSSE